jgi:hypothetical protein
MANGRVLIQKPFRIDPSRPCSNAQAILAGLVGFPRQRAWHLHQNAKEAINFPILEGDFLMVGRREFGLTGIAAAAALAMKATAVADDKTGSAGHAGHGGMFSKCAEACSNCQRECDACAHHCAVQLAEGHKAHLMTLQTCLDCAALCATAAQIVSREGIFSNLACTACADACARCGKECDKHQGDKMMAACAEECRRCEKACRDMVAMAKFE